MGKLTDKVAKGLFWVLMEKFGIQAVHFVVTLVLARLLTPNDYGTVALLSIFITISNVFVDCGFGKALVQKKTATQVDYNSVFYLSMAIAAILYAGLFFASPWVAEFYRIPELKVMLRVLALSLVFHSINGVQNVELNRKMLFHLSFRISWVSALVKAVVGVTMAFCGYGPWALVWASIAGGVAGVISRQFVIAWRPTLSFSWASVKELFSFGWKVTVSSLVDQVYANLQALLIGRIYTRADLAFVNKGRHIPNLLSNITTQSLRRVAFSALAKLQDDPERLRNAMRRMIKCSTFCVFPMMIMVGVLADPMIEMLFGPRWLPAVPYLRVTCFSVALRQFDTVNLQALMARGRSDIVMRLTIIRRAICLVIMAATLHMGIFVFYATAVLVVVPLGVVMNAYPNRRHLGYTLAMQFGDVAESFLLSLALGGLLWGTTYVPELLHVHNLWLLPVQVVVAAVFYVGVAVALRLSPVREIAKALQPQAEKKFGADSRLSRLLDWSMKNAGRAHA
ncbi:MAG: lipopolysaccharide biosynthesis protein [Kiritimatiellia bacterium]